MAGTSFTVGVAAPIAAAFYGGGLAIPVFSVVVGAIIWLLAAAALHAIAQAVLGGLKE